MSGPPVTPLLTVDVIIELPDGKLVLIERAHQPLGTALPGGFVDVGETVEAAAVREAKEETGLDVTLTELLGVYSDPARDPRGHSVSVVFVGQAQGEPVSGDDARRAFAAAPDGLPEDFVFDHSTILRDYRKFRAEGLRPRPA